jgi:threonine/homoserine/homoserine lactone efflux protein
MSLFGAYASTLVLTLTNPLTILSFAAIFAGLGLANTAGDYASAAALVAGVFSGSAAWWCILSGAAGAVRTRLRTGGLAWVNRISGSIIAAFGLIALASLWP